MDIMSMIETSVFLDRVSKATGEGKETVMAKGVLNILSPSCVKLTLNLLRYIVKYEVASANEMEAKYQSGKLEEEGSWRDLFRLTHLEERKAALEKLLEEASFE